MGNWSELQRDVLNLVANRLTVAADRAGFNGVCRNWSSLAQSKPNYLPCNPPWLILVENSGCSSRRAFVGLTEFSSGKESFDLDLPEAEGTRCLSSTGCWLVMIDADINMFILNPFSRAKIELPPLCEFKDFIEYWSDNPSMSSLFLRDHFLTGRVCLSFPLSKSPAEAFIAVAIFDGNQRLAYTRKGAKSWTKIDTSQSCFFDIAFYQGKFYAVNGFGSVFEFSISFKPHGKPQLKPVSDTLMISAVERYLVELEGMLLQVVRHASSIGEPLPRRPGKNYEDYDYKTDSVDVFELDFLTGGWKVVNDLGQHSIFAGFNTCVSLLASSSSTFKPNCIYFTDDNSLGYIGDSPFKGGRDMVVFNLDDRTIQPLYTGRYSLSSFSPPIWVIPTSMYHSKK